MIIALRMTFNNAIYIYAGHGHFLIRQNISEPVANCGVKNLLRKERKYEAV